MRKKIFWALILIFSINLILSSYLEFKDFSVSQPGICNIIQGKTDCTTVQQSPYAYILGVRNTTIGIFSSLIFLVLTTIYYKKPHKQLRRAKNILLFLGAIFAARFIYLQFFVIKQICPYCMIIDSLTIISFILFYMETRGSFD